ncbi:hypothetical protein QBC34DRAFT_37048 [Podospora aff. communis PSN243]|uniref:Uncharacterized protein n=1 Tax=Podospora aff. communis PSN243 TaxID=3040156 RepID=A0AAV9GVV0_9PEZI|nr:hypothetical protein QBC34DRAFT_37048 [Podospora aff. communis PSN243]
MADMAGFVSSPSSCDCYVDGEEMAAAVQIEFPRNCLEQCRSQFMESVVGNWTGTGRDKDMTGWQGGCSALTSENPDDVQETNVKAEWFWRLYWCDMRFCGVAIHQDGGLEQDPNVGFIINTCQNIGFHSVLDPGPPPTTFSCKTANAERSICTATQGHAAGEGEKSSIFMAQNAPTLSSSAVMPASTSHIVESAMTTNTETRAALVPTSSSTLTTTPSATHAHLGSETGQNSKSSPNSTTSSSPLSSGAKVAIGVCSALALVALIALALFCLYRAKRRRSSLGRSLRTHLRLTSQVPPSSSPTPLIHSTYSGARHQQQEPPLTPPLRLRDRRFLPSILRPGNRSPSPPLTPLTPAYSPSPHAHHLHPGSNSGAFPSSPICSPTTSKLIPRHERARVHAGSVSSASTTNPAVPAASQSQSQSRGSLSSYGAPSASSITGTGKSSLRNEISPSQNTYAQVPFAMGPPHSIGTATTTYTVGATPPSSPIRPPRPHDAPLEIPDLVSPGPDRSATGSPLGPPPTRALPPPPPPPPPPLGSAGTASFTAVGGGRSLLPKGVQIVRDRELEGEYDPRGSWGSWSGTASGVGKG